MEKENIIILRFNLSRDKALLLLSLLFLCWHPKPLGSEVLELTTYYPAPFGGYVSLLTTSKTLLARDSGNVGIGNNGLVGFPAAKLHVFGGGSGNVDLKVNGRIQTGDAAGDGGVWLNEAHDVFVGNLGVNTGFSSDGWNADRLAINKVSGNVGIGTANPLRKLQVAGDVRIGSSGVGGSGALYGLCHKRNFGNGISSCDAGTVVTAIYGTECDSGGVLLTATGADMKVNTSWIPHRAQNCAGEMLCCRILTGD